MNVERQAAYLVSAEVMVGRSEARSASIAVIRRAIQIEEGRPSPRFAVVRFLKDELRRKEREAAEAPKERA